MCNSETTDRWLSIALRTAIISGLLATGWFFFLREESSPHVDIRIQAQVTTKCFIRVNVEVTNLGGRVWKLGSVTVTLYSPDFNRKPKAEDLEDNKLVTQIRVLDDTLRIGEKTTFGFNFKPVTKGIPYYEVQAVLNIVEENQKWIRVQEGIVIIEDCK